MSASLQLVGLEDFKKALWKIPIELTELGDAIVAEAADRAAAAIRAAYPVGPGKADGSYEGGNLRKGVKVVKGTKRRSAIQLSTQFSTARVVRSTAPHAYLFETGTVVRANVSRDGVPLAKPANRGFMPGSNIFVPLMQRHRREMYEDLTALFEQIGLDVRR